MKFKLKDIDQKWKEYALAGCVCIIFYLALSNLGKLLGYVWSFLSVFKVVFLGFIIAYIMNPMARMFDTKILKKIKKNKPRWTLSVLITIIIFIAIIAILLASLIPQVIDNIISLVDNFSSYMTSIGTYADELSTKYEFLGASANNMFDQIVTFLTGSNGLLEKLGELLKSNVKGIAKATSTVGTTAMNWIVAAIIAVYFLMAKEGIKGVFAKFFKLVMKPHTYMSFDGLLEKFNTIFSKYIVCELIDSLIVGICNYIFMLIAGMPDALFISFIVGITNLAPTFGPIAGAAVGGVILLLLKPGAVILFLIFTLVLQTIDGYVIKPKLFGGALNVPGVIILIAIIVFGKIFGVVGMLIAIPVAAIIVYVYTELFIPWLELKRDVKAYNKEMNALDKKRSVQD